MILRVIGPLIILLMVAGTTLPAASASSEVGTIRDLTPLDPEHIPLSNPVNVVTGGPPFLMSDNPEWVTQPGIHSLATFTGRARFFWFIANHTDTIGPLFFTLVGRNTGTQPAHVQITKLGRMQGNDYEVAGQEALYRYFLSGTDPATGSLGSSAALLANSGSLPGEVVILPGETQFIVPELNRAPVFKNWVSVVYLELTTDQPVTFYVEAVKQPTLDVDALSYLKPDVAEDGSITGRGTFEASEREMHFVIDSLPARLIIAADQYHSRQRWDDPPLVGTDEMNGAVTVDDGNYGLLYRLRLTVTAPSDKPLGVYFSPVPTSGIATAVRVVSPYQAIERLPKEQGTRVESTRHGVLAAIIPPTAAGPQEIVFETFPPAGANAIMPVIIAPLE